MRISCSFVILASLAATAAAAQVRLKEVGDEIGVGRKLSGEECRLRLIERFGLYCGTSRQPSALAQSFRTSNRYNALAFIRERASWRKP